MKICCDQCSVLLIAPMWSRWVWFTRLLDLVWNFPRVVPLQYNLLFQQLRQRCSTQYCRFSILWHGHSLRGSLRARGFSRKAAKLISRAMRKYTSAVYEIGRAVGDLVDKVWFPFLPLWQKELILWLESLKKLYLGSEFRLQVSYLCFS